MTAEGNLGNTEVNNIGNFLGVVDPTAVMDPTAISLAAPGLVDRAMDRFYRLKPIRGAFVAVAGMSLAACGAAAASIDSHSKAHHNTDGTHLTVSTTAALERELTVSLDSSNANCVKIVEAADPHANTDGSIYDGMVTPRIGAEDGLAANSQGGRLWSDAIEDPLPSPENAGLSLTDIEATICRDPLLGDTVANEFATMEIGDVKVVNLNSWLKPYDFDASQPENKIATEASSFFPTVDGTSISETNQSNADYEQLAENLITLLDRFQNTGEATNFTTFNYVLSGGDLVADEMPQVYLNPEQYDAQAIWLTLTKKTGGCYVQIGFNVGDQRPEGTDVCATPPAAPGTPVKPAAPGTPNHYIPPTGRTYPTSPNTAPTAPSTSWIGPKQDAHPPVPGGEATTIPPDQKGGPTPTTETTAPPETTQPTTPASTSTSTSTPAGGCGANC
jgi:hypothetical protein